MNLSNSSHANATLGWLPGLPYTQITLYSILLVWSLLGNVLVIAVVYFNQNLRANMNYMIVNMAVSDLLVPLVGIPWTISTMTLRPREWLVDGPLGEALCKLVPFLSDISPYVSSINLVIIAFQRSIAVVYPTRRPILIGKTRYILMISFPWIVAMALFSPYFYTLRLRNEWGYTECYFSWSPEFEHFTAETTFLLIIGTVGFFIPFIGIVTLYSIIQYKLRENLNNVVELIGREMIRARQQKNRRIFYMSVTMITMFIICWLPLGVLNLLLSFQHPINADTIRKMFFAFSLMWYLLAAINPCIYFLFLKDYRQGLKNNMKIFKCACGCRVAQTEDSNQDPTCTPPHIYITSV